TRRISFFHTENRNGSATIDWIAFSASSIRRVATAGFRAPNQTAASSRSQSKSGCFSSERISNPAFHPFKIVCVHGLSHAGIFFQLNTAPDDLALDICAHISLVRQDFVAVVIHPAQELAPVRF